MAFAIRVQAETGSAMLSIEGSLRFCELKQLVRERLQLPAPPDNFVLLAGFPPKEINAEADAPVNSVLNSDETVRVKLSTCSQSTQPQTRTQASAKLPEKRASQTNRSSKQLPSSLSSSKSGGIVHTLRGTMNLSRPTPQPKKRRRTKLELGSEEDVSFLMLDAVSGGKGRKNKFMRDVFRRAVDKQYDAAKADARVTSALTGKYEMSSCENARRLGDGKATMLNVTFAKGGGARTNYEETVDLVEPDALKAIVHLVLRSEDPNSKEMLKPMNLAGCSPRVFWSLVQAYGGDIWVALRELLPQEDWSFMDVRQRQMSVKAKENYEQELELKKEREQRKRDRDVAGFDEVVDSDEDDDFKRRGGQPEVIQINDKVDEEDGVEESADEEEDELSDFVCAEHLRLLSEEPLRIDSLSSMANADADHIITSLKDRGIEVSDEIVGQWVTTAREKRLDSMWWSICDEREELIQALQQMMICTPRDLGIWDDKSAMQLLVEELNKKLVSFNASGQSADSETAGTAPVTLDQVAVIIRRAQRLREKYAWLSDWVSYS